MYLLIHITSSHRTKGPHPIKWDVSALLHIKLFKRRTQQNIITSWWRVLIVFCVFCSFRPQVFWLTFVFGVHSTDDENSHPPTTKTPCRSKNHDIRMIQKYGNFWFGHIHYFHNFFELFLYISIEYTWDYCSSCIARMFDSIEQHNLSPYLVSMFLWLDLQIFSASHE
jgi:hypothetical protein